MRSLGFVSFGLLTLSSVALPEGLAVRARTLHTMAEAGTIRDAIVLVEDGKIRRVGKASEIQVPPAYQELSVEVLTPGFLDAHTIVGLSGLYNVPADQDESEATDPNGAELRAIDGFNPTEPLLGHLLRHGVTTIQACPGPENPIAGQAGIFKTAGKSPHSMALRFPSALVFTLGERPKEVYGERQVTPSTRMGTAAVIRQALNAGGEYRKKLARFEAGEAKERPERDLEKEALGKVVAGELPALFTAHREDDILTAIRIAREFELRLIIDGATEGYLVAEAIRAARVPVLVHPTMQRVGRPETLSTTFENAALLADRGIRVAIQGGGESYVPKARLVLFEAAVAMANGLGFERALASITRDPADILGVSDRVGRIAAGKDADLVGFDGDPFEYTTHVTAVVLDGRVVHRRAP